MENSLKVKTKTAGVTILLPLYRRALKISRKRFGKANFSKLVRFLIQEEIERLKK